MKKITNKQVALLTLLATVILGVGAYFMPEIRRLIGLEKSAPTSSVRQTTKGAGSVAVNGNGNRVSTNVEESASKNGEKK